MSGGSSAALILQMTRAHFARDDGAFASAANQLGRMTKDEEVRRRILGIVHQGFTRPAPDAQPQRKSMEYRPPMERPAALTQPTSRLLEPLKPVSFAELMTDPDIQQVLDEIVIELEYREELAKRNLRARNRLIFWGPPGNGKTSHGAAMAAALGVPAFAVSLPRLIAKYIGETGQNLGELFDAMKHDTVVVFDELDAVGSSRGNIDSSAGKEQNNAVNTLLTLLDRHEKGVLIATTNRPDMLDPALLRRFDEQVKFPAPNAIQMRGLAAKLSAHYGVPEVSVSGCENFDAVAKTVMREARRIVMQELLAEKEEEEDGEEENTK